MDPLDKETIDNAGVENFQAWYRGLELLKNGRGRRIACHEHGAKGGGRDGMLPATEEIRAFENGSAGGIYGRNMWRTVGAIGNGVVWRGPRYRQTGVLSGSHVIWNAGKECEQSED
jgi:hypothetical protein